MSCELIDEVDGVDLGDQRLNDRLTKMLPELGSKPTMSVPSATHSRTEMEGAYRFFANDKVSPEKILQPHMDSTRRRILQHDFVLLVQDTTELDLTRPNQQVHGAGPIDSDSRRGAFFHPLMAFNGEGLPLGMVWQRHWARERLNSHLTPKEKARKRAQTPIEAKESMRWLEGCRAAREVAEACPQTTCVCVCDSEGDIYELFSEPRSTEQGELHLLVRAGQSRCTTDQSNWFEKARQGPCLDRNTVRVSSRTAKIASTSHKREKSRDARIAEVEVRAATITMRPPSRPDRKLPEVTVNVVLVEEPSPTQDAEPIQWLLVTTLPIDNLEQVRTVVQSYCLRWQIEIYFRTLKSGCQVESRQFETLPRVMNCLALYSIVAWRIMYLCRLSRDCPDMSCEVVFEPAEWKSVHAMTKRTPLPKTPPSLNEMIRLIASLGGYVIRPKTQPGPQTLWLGLQRVHDISAAWKIFGPETRDSCSQTCVER